MDRDVSLSRFRKPRKVNYTVPRMILNTVCSYYGEDVGDVLGSRRHKNLCTCRHVTAYLLRRHTSMTFESISKFLGGRHHRTAMVSIDNVTGWMKYETELASQVQAIQCMIGVEVIGSEKVY